LITLQQLKLEKKIHTCRHTKTDRHAGIRKQKDRQAYDRQRDRQAYDRQKDRQAYDRHRDMQAYDRQRDRQADKETEK
jgi:hypothetical protein